MAKARSEIERKAAKIVVALIPARTDTHYWHDHVAGKTDVYFLRGRLRFGANGQSQAPVSVGSRNLGSGCRDGRETRRRVSRCLEDGDYFEVGLPIARVPPRWSSRQFCDPAGESPVVLIARSNT